MNIYEIRVRGRLDAHWAAWFEGMTLAYDGDTTVLCGSLVDEAALHGVLSKVAELNLHLLSVNAVAMDEADSVPSPAIGSIPPPSPLSPSFGAPPGLPGADTATPKQHGRTQRKHSRKRFPGSKAP
ncbi:MAG TPA: hypothetical protein VH591_06260 [Ktedonobacterales bacterium]